MSAKKKKQRGGWQVCDISSHVHGIRVKQQPALDTSRDWSFAPGIQPHGDWGEALTFHLNVFFASFVMRMSFFYNFF